MPRRQIIRPLEDEPRVAQVSADSVVSAWGGWGQGWSGADFSPDRGYVYWPQDDTRRDLPTYSLWEMRRRSRFLDANVGFAGRINRGIARAIVGTGLMIRATTRDAEWNRERMELFQQRNGTAAVVDLGRKWDFYSMQLGMQETANVDGDIGSILTSSLSGLARLAFIEAHRIANGRLSAGEVRHMVDGVMTDAYNAPVAYRVLGDDGAQVDVPYENFLYLGQPSRPVASARRRFAAVRSTISSIAPRSIGTSRRRSRTPAGWATTSAPRPRRPRAARGFPSRPSTARSSRSPPAGR
jgi:hypothetical protein